MQFSKIETGTNLCDVRKNAFIPHTINAVIAPVNITGRYFVSLLNKKNTINETGKIANKNKNI